MVNVLDKGFVKLEDSMGGDLRVVNSAKVSFVKHSSEVGEPEKKLINFLMKHRHGTPFEHSVFTFHVKAPIFVTREWQRHRIGSFNEMSGRYVEFEPDFYWPEQLRISAATNKQGSVVPDTAPENFVDVNNWNVHLREQIFDSYNSSFDDYKYLIDNGVAKEMARMVLPVSLYTEFYWTVNARSLMNFLELRSGQDAQWEIREYANAMMPMFEERMPATYEAWIANNRIAP